MKSDNCTYPLGKIMSKGHTQCFWSDCECECHTTSNVNDIDGVDDRRDDSGLYEQE